MTPHADNATHTRSGEPRVLVVDDEPAIVESLGDLLESEYTVFKATDARQALHLLDNEEIGVIVSDQRMPDLDGAEFLGMARQKSDATRVLLTGYADIEAVAKAVNNGQIYAYAAKPWEPAALRQLIRRAWDHFRLSHELVYEQQIHEQLMAHSLDGIYFAHADGTFALANPAFAAVVGVAAPAALAGKRPRDVLDPAAAAAFERAAQRVLAGETVRDEVQCLHRADGQVVWTSSNFVALHSDEHRKLPALMAIVRDISERRRIEHELQQAQKLQSIGRLAGGVAHDFNNILTAINGYAQLLLQPGRLDAQTAEDVGEIVRAAERAQALTRQLLAFGRKQVLRPRLVDLNEQVGALTGMLRQIVGNVAPIEVQCAAEPVVAEIDPGQLDQILLNLVVNARDALGSDGRIVVATSRRDVDAPGRDGEIDLPPGSYAVVEVVDNGAGIDDATRPNIFEPFFTTKPEGEGTGLGLATVYGIVRQSGGYVDVESAVGKGSTFRLYFPRRDGRPAQIQNAVALAEGESGHERILVVDDDAVVLRVTARVLERYGYQVQAFDDPRAALAAIVAAPQDYALVVADLVMPGLRGTALLAELRDRGIEVPLLLTSGYAEDLATVAADGAQPWLRVLPKPFSATTLAQTARAMIEGPSGA